MELLVPGTTTFELVRIPPGEFRMGSTNEYFSETPAHAVNIRSSFLMGKYPATRAQWKAVMSDDPSASPGEPTCPVDGVSWDQAQKFCERVSELVRRRVRLPSEAEWEYACRAGTMGEFFFGSWGPCLDDTEVPWAARQSLCEYAWFEINSKGGTCPVGKLRPNPWGLHDMIGNVWEWCEDVWHDDYKGSPSDGSPWVADGDQEQQRCLRGGAWNMNAFRCRSPYRSYDYRQLGTSRFGLRVAVEDDLLCSSGCQSLAPTA